MADQAQISSVEAIEFFRAKLIEYVGQMRPTLGEIGNEVVRTRMWLDGEHRHFWERELRLRARRLEEAKQELFNATMAQLNEAAALHHMAVNRAKRAVEEAERKLKLLRKWSRDIDQQAAPLMKQVDQLHGFVGIDMGKAVAYLDNILKSLEAYRNMRSTAPDG